ncbi:hypothetical protein KOR42_24350 [Thalassoglobus neptunius]|uniref:Uncharacterized protein n=1 Tax=Thalassoglobus neptunius TaxID=1938619 RepID=A0A5C5X7L7_9PLAN|nr:hypothetical protein KOR42_24350 [Thalassoglobus neptunius]
MLLTASCVLRRINIVVSNAFLKVVEMAFQVGHAPSATCPSPTAFAELTGAAGFGDSHVIQNLAFRNMETQTNRVIKLHISPFVDQPKQLSPAATV